MNFTDSPFEKMMKQIPRQPRSHKEHRPPPGSPCRACSYWRGDACIGVCYRDLVISLGEGRETSGQLVPKSRA